MTLFFGLSYVFGQKIDSIIHKGEGWITVIVLSAVVLVGSGAIWYQLRRSKLRAKALEAVDTPPAMPEATPSSKVEAPAAAAPVASRIAGSETDTTVENDLYKIVFTNRGAQVKSWILKKYKDDDGKPLDLVNKETAKFGLPLGLRGLGVTGQHA